MTLRFVLTALWLVVGWGLTQPCADFSEGKQELDIEDFGTAYFSSLPSTDLQAGEATLADGVCIVGLDGWELRSETLSIKGLEGDFNLEASNVSLIYFGWRLNAVTLMATTETVTIGDVSFRNESVAGKAQTAVFDLRDNVLSLEATAAEGSGFRIQGEKASLQGDLLFFEDAVATTCVCEGGALYIIKAGSASYDLTDKAVIINDGQLVVGGVTIALPDLDLSEETLANIAFPITVEYVADDEAEGTEGTGLGLRVSNVRVAEGLRLELGIVGIDRDYPLNGVLVLHYDDDKASFDFGQTARGFQADFSVREPLLPWLDMRFRMRNRDWKEANFLHEGSLSLVAQQRYSVSGHRFDLSQGIFAAASSQIVSAGRIGTPRLGGYAASSYRSPEGVLGQFNFRLRAEATDYPLVGKTQFGLRLQPSWVKSFDAWELSLGWNRLFTNAESPFAKSLDKLEARNELRLGVKADGKLSENVSATFALGLRYDFLAPIVNGTFGEQFDAAGFSANLNWKYNDFILHPFIDAEFAPVFNSTLTGVDSYIEGGVNVEYGRVQGGFAIRFDPALDSPLEKIELSTSFPLDFETVTLEPFLAFDMLPTLSNGDFPRVSGQGLKLTWRSCCGTIIASFKQVENVFSTDFAFQLSEP